jgi:hypothetical protein
MFSHGHDHVHAHAYGHAHAHGRAHDYAYAHRYAGAHTDVHAYADAHGRHTSLHRKLRIDLHLVQNRLYCEDVKNQINY